jgi:hypothetical protein
VETGQGAKKISCRRGKKNFLGAYIQGDQIGIIFAIWAIVYIGSYFEIANVSQILATIFLSKSRYVNKLDLATLLRRRFFHILIWSPCFHSM